LHSDLRRSNCVGLVSILTSRVLRATHIEYLNDATESRGAWDLARDMLSEALPPLGMYTLDPRHTPEQLAAKDLWHSSSWDERRDRYVSCFCEDGDLLSQWRGYSSSNYGFSVGFKHADLVKLHDGAGLSLGKCIYSKNLKRKILEELISDAVAAWVTARSKTRRSEICAKFWDMVSTVGAYFKDQSFSEEKEWRLVSQPASMTASEIKFHPGKSMITPYTEISLGSWINGAIGRVYIGPCPHMKLSKRSVVGLLVRTTGSHTRDTDVVKLSEIPYRAW
jgi:hypothetical protein